jgi:hypothetical protein
MKLSFEKLNKLTICGWSIWFIAKAFQQEGWELFVTCFFSPFVLFLVYLVHVKIPTRGSVNKKSYEIGGFISLNCLALALCLHL